MNKSKVLWKELSSLVGELMLSPGPRGFFYEVQSDTKGSNADPMQAIINMLETVEDDLDSQVSPATRRLFNKTMKAYNAFVEHDAAVQKKVKQ